MKVEKNRVVSFHYSLTALPSEIKESTLDGEGEPVLYLHGHGNIVRGLEKALEGHSVGDKIEVTVQPIDGYGLVNDDLKQRVPNKHLLTKKKLRPGMQVQLNTDKGARWVTVLKVGKFSVDVDANHPFAGQTLEFNIEIVDIRDATPEEVSHRHAHGPGGHHHH